MSVYELLGIAIAIAGLGFTLLAAVVTAAIAWGTLRSEVRNNFRAHCELAAELRPKVTQLSEHASNSKAQHDTLEERLRGFKEQLDRIEGSLVSNKGR